jgi:hypothetical protein
VQHHPGYLIGADALVSDTGYRTSDLVCVKAAPAATQYRPGQRVRRDLGTCIRLNVLVLGTVGENVPSMVLRRPCDQSSLACRPRAWGLEAGASLYLPARGLGSRAVLPAPSPRSGLSQLLLQLAFLLLQVGDPVLSGPRAHRAAACPVAWPAPSARPRHGPGAIPRYGWNTDPPGAAAHPSHHQAPRRKRPQSPACAAQ